jgi:hypothetical protein
MKVVRGYIVLDYLSSLLPPLPPLLHIQVLAPKSFYVREIELGTNGDGDGNGFGSGFGSGRRPHSTGDGGKKRAKGRREGKAEGKAEGKMTGKMEGEDSDAVGKEAGKMGKGWGGENASFFVPTVHIFELIPR